MTRTERQVARLDDLGAVARTAAGQVVDAARAWTEQLGPFYDTEGVRHLLTGRNGPVSRQACPNAAACSP